MDLPCFDLQPYLSLREEHGDTGTTLSGGQLDLPAALKRMCKDIAASIQETGILVIRDPRCSSADNARFLDMMEKYFSQADRVKREQERPHYHYQVGVTPEGVEVPRIIMDRALQATIEDLPADSRPHLPTGADLKWRYFWRAGSRPVATRFTELNAEPVVPAGFPEWAEVMDGWGGKMIAAVEVVAEMMAMGFGLPRDAFTARMKEAPHLLAPTGSDLVKHGREGAVLAGYHYDLNFLTIHGRSRFPGLFVWRRDGARVPVCIPEGFLLVQAGKQLEWLTGGACRAGMHEVLVTRDTLAAAEGAQREGRCPWRVSSTLFAHIASDTILEPLGPFASSESAASYPPTYAGEYVEEELAVLKLRRASEDAQAPLVEKVKEGLESSDEALIKKGIQTPSKSKEVLLSSQSPKSPGLARRVRTLGVRPVNVNQQALASQVVS